MIEISATADKQQLGSIAMLKGYANAQPITLSGLQYGIGEIQFVRFAAQCHIPTRQYVGTCYLQQAPPDCPQADLALLAQITGGTQHADDANI